MPDLAWAIQEMKTRTIEMEACTNEAEFEAMKDRVAARRRAVSRSPNQYFALMVEAGRTQEFRDWAAKRKESK